MLLWVVLTFLFIVTHIQPFLSVSQPIKADVLVVEGWVIDDVLQAASREFKRGNYQLLITTGSTLARGFYLSDYKTHAELAAATLVALGIESDQIIAIPTPEVKIDRTAASALTVKQWLDKANLPIKSLNIYSFDVHTRRSWLTFKKVLEPNIKVGAIAYSDPAYDAKRWWTSSNGFKSVLNETIGYLYAKLISVEQ